MSDYTGAPTTVTNVVNGVHQELTAAQVSTAYGSGNIKTPTKNFTLNYKGLHINGFKNIPIVCDAALLAALAAVGAPVV